MADKIPIRKKFEFNRESKLRYSCLMYSIRIEIALLDISYFSNSEQFFDQTKKKYLKLKALTLGAKIDRVSELLQLYHNDLFVSNKSMFDDLVLFKDLRNRLCHCAIHFPSENIDEIDIWDVKEDEVTKFQYMSPFRYSYPELAEEITSGFNKIIKSLLPLRLEVQTRLQVSDSLLYNALLPAASRPDQ